MLGGLFYWVSADLACEGGFSYKSRPSLNCVLPAGVPPMSGQMIDRRICCLALSLLIASCSAAYGQVAPASATVVLPTQSSSIEQLVIGDRYEVAVQRGEAKEQYHGTLVKATDRWLVLLNKYESRTERGVPVAAKVPYLNRLFRNVGIGRPHDRRKERAIADAEERLSHR
jgi:hypothetical protein